jgi:hypothetical protein
MALLASRPQTRLAPGHSLESFRHDGLQLARRRRHRRTLPLRHIALFLLACAAFRVFLCLELGAVGYESKRLELASGNPLDRVAAAAMALDPVSEWAVQSLRHAW